MNLRVAVFVFLSIVKGVALAEQADGRADGTVLARIVTENKNLDPNDPRELGMKVRSLLRDEYTFFRGSAPEFYRLAASCSKGWMDHENDRVTLHGDVHIGNVGTYQGPGEGGRDIRFGVVDLDETIQGPFQFDLLRALTGLRFAAQTGGRTGGQIDIAEELCAGYARTLSGEEPFQDVVKRNSAAVALLRKAAKSNARKYVSRYAEMEPSPHFRTARIKDGKVKDILEPLTDSDREAVVEAVWSYLDGGCETATRERFRFHNKEELRSGIQDVARWTRVESSGSQGVHKYLVLLDKPLKGDETPLILELKEEPTPAPSVAGLFSSPAGPKRAEEVAAGYELLLDPPPRLIGFSRIGDRGFLVRTKDPWGEDLEPADIGIAAAKDGAVQAAVLLGEVLGEAHRNSLLLTKHSERIPEILDRLPDMVSLLHDRSKLIEQQLREEFESLRADPQAKELADRADEFIKRIQNQGP